MNGNSTSPEMWTVSRDATPDYAPQFTIYANDGTRIATTHGAEAESNAQLFFAAREMLAALRGLLYCPDLNLDDLEDDTRESLAEAIAAVARATYIP